MSQNTEDAFAAGSLGLQIDAARDKRLSTQAVVADRAKGQTLGWSSTLVRDNREEADREIGKRTIGGNDLFASWAKTSEENAAIALEDTGNLLAAFDALQREKQRQALLTKAEKMGVALDRGGAQVRQSLLGFGQMLMETVGREGLLNALVPTTIDTGTGEVIENTQRAGILQEAREKDARSAEEFRAERQASIQGMPAPLLDSNLFYDLVESAPQMLAQIGAGAAGTALAGPVGGSLASMGLMVPQIAGGQYGNLRDDGVSVGHAALAATANAVIQAPMESLSLNRFFNIFKASGLKAVGRATAESMLTEGGTEYLQQFPEVGTDIAARMAENGEGNWLHSFLDRLPQTHKEGMHDAVIGAIWGITGGAGRLAYERAHAARATEWRGRMAELFDHFSQTTVKQQSPEITQGIMEHAGMDGNAYVDATEALRLFQSGALDLDLLDISEPQLTEAAAMGQDIPVKAARLVAYAKDKAEFTSLINMTRDVPYAETVAEVEREGRKQEDIDRVVEVLKEQSVQDEQFNSEVTRLETEIAGAVEETDPLQKQAVTLAGGVANYARDEAARIAAFARRNHADPEQRLAFLRKWRVQGEDSARLEQEHRTAEESGRFGEKEEALSALVREADGLELPPDAGPLPDLEELGETFTPEEYAHLQDQQALMAELGITANMSEAQRARKLNPWLEAVWGRLDGASLRQDYPEAFKAIIRNYGPGVFRSRERGGLPADYLAAELVEGNVFQQGMGADDLVERLKAPRDGSRLFQAAQVTSAKESLRRDVEAWGRQVDKIQIAGASPSGHTVMLRQTPLVLQLIGRDAKTGKHAVQGGLYVSSHTIDNALKGAHDVTLDMLKQIPEAMADPIAIFDSASEKAKGDVVFMLELKDRQGKTLVVPVALQGRGGKGKEINIVKSAYGKGGKTPAVQWFLEQVKENARYMNGQKFERWARDAGVQFPFVAPNYGPANAHGNTVYTDADLVNLRAQNPTLYQSAALGSVTITPDNYTVLLGKNANLSTLTHETGHIFEEELRRIVRSGQADEQQIADLATLDAWLSRFDDDAALREEYNSRLKRTYFNGRKFEKLGAAEKAQARELVKREYFARGFEAYVREGKAPSEGLRGLFDRFKRWLLEIYKDAKSLGVDLNDDVRGVFDRMLATDRELEETAAVNELFDMTQSTLDKLDVKGADREYMSGLLRTAKEQAAADVERERVRERGTRIRQWTEEARAELDKDPVYQARDALRQPGGHLNAAAVTDTLGPEAAARLRKSLGPGAVRQEGGQDPHLFAAEHGFEDAAHMLAALTGVPGKGARIKEIVAAREAMHDAEVDPAPYLLKTEAAARRIAMAGEYLSRSLGRQAVQDRALATVAASKLSAMPMGQARGHLTFVAAMRRALKRERAAVARGDMETALTANTQARLSLEFARQALDIEEARQKTENAARRFVASQKADPAARYAVNVLAAKYDLMPLDERLAGGKSWNTIAEWYAERKKDGYPLAPDEDMFMAGNRPWRELTWREFSDLAQEMLGIATVERNRRKLLAQGAKADFAQKVTDLTASIAAHHPAQKLAIVESAGVIRSGLRKVHALHLKPEVLLRILDGDTDLGENWTCIYKPINDAALRQGQYYKALDERLKSAELFGAYTADELSAMASKKEYVEEIGESVTKGQRIMAALNRGNAGNYQRLKDGANWNDAQVAALIQTLDSRDWTLVINLWKTFEQYKPEAFALHERVTGQRPTEVEATPFTVKTADGKTLHLPGGYFPVIYDRVQADPKLQDLFSAGDTPSWGASTKKGHLNERTATGAGTALKLDLSAVPRALQDVITDICFREALIDVGRILRNRDYRQAVESAVGREMYAALVDWLKHASGSRAPLTPGEGMARWARNSVSIMSMGLKVSTMIAQPFGITQSADRLGWSRVTQGIAEAYAAGPAAMLKKAAWVRSVSSFMDNRLKSYDREVAAATADFAQVQLDPQGLLDLVTPQSVKKLERWLKKNAFVPMGVAQFGVDLPTWLGAYAKGLEDFNGDDARAIDYADHIVRLTQGSGEAKDLAQIQRGGEYAKLFTMFYSYFSQLYGLFSLRAYDVNTHRDMGSALRAANSFLLLVAVPAVLGELAARRGPDDDEEYWKWAAKLMTIYPLQTLIGVRDVAQFIDGKYGYSASPAEDAPGSIYTLLKQVADIAADPEKFDPKKLGKITLRTLGYMKGLPLKQAEISAFNIINYLDGTNSDFEFLDLLFTRPKNRR